MAKSLSNKSQSKMSQKNHAKNPAKKKAAQPAKAVKKAAPKAAAKKAAAKAVPKAGAKSAAKPAAKAAAKSAAKPVSKSVTKSVVKSVTESVANLVAKIAPKAAEKSGAKTGAKGKTSSLASVFTPLDDRVIIEKAEPATRTAGGLYIPDTVSSDARSSQGLVVAVGRGRRNKKGQLRPLDVQLGDTVMFGTGGGSDVMIADESFLCLREDEIIAIVKL